MTHPDITFDATDPDRVCIRGIWYSTQIFGFFAESAEAGSLFRFVKRTDGAVTLETVVDNRAPVTGA